MKRLSNRCRSLTGAWIETKSEKSGTSCAAVAPLRGRGLKQKAKNQVHHVRRRSLTGAWIETSGGDVPFESSDVAPLRGRGLKPPGKGVTGGMWRSLPYGGVD